MNRRSATPWFVTGMVVSWSIYYAVSKWVVGATGSAFLAGLLLRAAALIILTVQLAVQGKLRLLLRQGRTALVLMLIGVFGYLLDTFANLGYSYGTLSTGTALLKTDVLMVNIATVVVYKKRLYPSDWLGTLVMLAGVALVLEIDWASMRLNWYDLFFLASALCVTVNAFLIKAVQQKQGADSDVIGYYNNLVVAALFLVSSLVSGDISKVYAPQSGSFWALTALGGLAQAGIYFFYYRTLKRMEVWLVKLYLLLMPILCCFIGILFLGEHLSAGKLVGIGVVLLGASVILLREKINPTAAGENQPRP